MAVVRASGWEMLYLLASVCTLAAEMMSTKKRSVWFIKPYSQILWRKYILAELSSSWFTVSWFKKKKKLASETGCSIQDQFDENKSSVGVVYEAYWREDYLLLDSAVW